MKRSLIAAALALGLAMPVWANPFDFSGTWRIDPERSSFSDGSFPPNMSLTVRFRITDGRIIYSSVNDTQRDRPPHLTDFTAPLDGTPAPFAGQTRFNQVSVRQLSATEFQVLKMMDGDVVAGEYWRFEPDGRQLVRRGVAKNPAGRSRAYDEWFVRTGGPETAPSP